MPLRSDPDTLDDLALRPGADIRSPLLRTLVDLYLQKPRHTAEETQHFTELTIRLLDQADEDTRAAIKRRLASYPSVPAAIMRRLTADTAEPAAPITPAGRASAVAPAADPPPPAPVSPAELSELFFAAGAAERRLILTNLTYAAPPAATPVTGDAHEAARQLETAALAHNPDAFMRALERWLGVSPALARRIVRDPLGEPIVVAAKALAIAPDAVQRILLFVNPAVGRSVARVYELALLFDTIDSAAALALLGIWRGADPQPAARPAPSDPAERSVRRPAATRAGAPQRGPADASARSA